MHRYAMLFPIASRRHDPSIPLNKPGLSSLSMRRRRALLMLGPQLNPIERNRRTLYRIAGYFLVASWMSSSLNS